MIKRFYILAVVILGMFSAIAQHDGEKKEMNPEERARKELKKLGKSLELTPEQTVILKPLTEEKFSQIKALKASKTEENKKEIHKSIKRIRETWIKEVKSNLTENQNKEFDIWLAEKKAKHEERKAEKIKAKE